MLRPYCVVDVFTDTPYRGNPVAVVLDGHGLTTEEMQRFAHWTNLSETTFVLPPSAVDADYRVRIFTPVAELPFAGHPTLGTCHAWLSVDPQRHKGDVVVQECPAGSIPIRRGSDRLAFAAPPLLRYEPVDDALVAHLASQLRLDRDDIRDAHWVDNGPGWVGLLLADADAVLSVEPGPVDHKVGVVGLYPPDAPYVCEIRAFFPKDGATVEDPVTGSFNASVARWLLDTGRLTSPYVASQGTALGRAGRIHITRDDTDDPFGDNTIWVGGGTVTCVTGQVEL